MSAVELGYEVPRQMKHQFQFNSSFKTKVSSVKKQNRQRNLHTNTYVNTTNNTIKRPKTIPVYAKVKTFKNQLEELMRFMQPSTNTVSRLRRYLARKFKVHLAQVDLLFQNRVLMDHQTMAGIGFGSTGYLTINITGEPAKEDDTLTVLEDAQSFVSLQLRSMDPKAMATFRLEEAPLNKGRINMYELKLPATFTAESLKMYLSEKLNRKTNTMKLIHKRNKRELEDKAQLRDELEENQVIRLLHRGQEDHTTN